MNKDYGSMQESASKKISHIKLGMIVLTLLLLVELYLMMNFPKVYILLVVIGVASLFLIYRIASSILKIQEEREKKRREEFESIFKSEKASYILLRKNFADLAEMLYLLKGDSNFPIEDLIAVQKSIAKVTINKNRESSKVLLSSTEELKNYLLEMNKKFAEIKDSVKENMDNVSELVKNEVQSKNLDVIIRLNELEKALGSEMERSLSSITISSSQTVMEPQELSETKIAEKIAEAEELKEEPEELEIPKIEELAEEPE
ncbi:MAG: hypothetical protein NC307_04715, partial [Roseburia sp.]|nr:hypothetical protein [Roseburia sp.]